VVAEAATIKVAVAEVTTVVAVVADTARIINSRSYLSGTCRTFKNLMPEMPESGHNHCHAMRIAVVD
jgi:hypothetical protein